MTNKQAVRTMEPHAMCEKNESGVWSVRKHPEGRVLGSGRTAEWAWYVARLTLRNDELEKLIADNLEGK